MQVARTEAKRRVERCSCCCIAPALFGMRPQVNAGVDLLGRKRALMDRVAADSHTEGCWVLRFQALIWW